MNQCEHFEQIFTSKFDNTGYQLKYQEALRIILTRQSITISISNISTFDWAVSTHYVMRILREKWRKSWQKKTNQYENDVEIVRKEKHYFWNNLLKMAKTID